MKNLTENDLMQEMNLSEMQDVNGGLLFLIRVAQYVLLEALLNPGEARDAFMGGYNSAPR